jgi:hypothetical protein
MAARIQTRSRNATTRPALPIIQLNEELDGDRKAERESNKRKAADKKQGRERALAKRLTNLERDIADEDAVDDTPRAPQPKAQKSAVSKPRHVREDSTMPDSEASGAEEPPHPCPDGEDKTDAPTTEDEQSEQEWSDSKVSHDDMPPSRKTPTRAATKQSAKTPKKVAAGKEPMTRKQKRSIRDALDREPELDTGDNEDFVDATPKPKGKPTAGKGEGLGTVTRSAKRRRNDLTVSIPVRIDGPVLTRFTTV